MSGAKKTITTLNGNNINDTSTYIAKFRKDSSIGETPNFVPITADIVGEFGDYVRAQPEGRMLDIFVKIVRAGTSNHFADVNQLKQWANPRSGEVLLKATDDASSPNTLRLTVVPLGVFPEDGTDWLYNIRCWVPRPIWQNDTENDTTESAYVGGAFSAAANDGNDYALPTITGTPQAYPANTVTYNKQRRVVVAWRSPMPGNDILGNPYPIEITNGGWDVEAKIKAGTLLPAGLDLLVYVDGVQSERYLSNFPAGYGTLAFPGDHTFANIRSFETGTLNAACRHAVKFRFTGCSEREQLVVDEVHIPMDASGSPVGTMTVQIREDSNGLPGAVVTNGTSAAVNANTITGTDVWTSFTFASAPVGSGATTGLFAKKWYWLELTPPATTNNSTNYIRWGYPASNAGKYEGEVNTVAHSTDGTTWTSGSSLSGVGNHDSSDYFGPLNFRIFVTGTAKIWVPMLFSGGLKLNMAGSPSAGATADWRITDFEGYTRLPEQFYLARDNECLQAAKDGTDRFTLTVAGGRRGTTAVAHTASSPMYWVEHYVQVVFNYQQQQPVKSDYEPDGLAPVIDGRNSTNSQFRWIGPFLAHGNETRPMTWAAEQDDGVDSFDLTSLDGDGTNDLTDVTFKDATSAGAFIARNAIAQNFPTGIKAAASAITMDVTAIASAMQIEHLLTNERGEEEVLYTSRNIASDIGTGETFTPTEKAYRYRLRASGGVVTGCETADAADLSSVFSPTYYLGNTFELDDITTITGVAMRVKRGASRTFTAAYVILPLGDDDLPDATNPLAQSSTFSNTDTTTTYTNVVKTFTNAVTLSAGTYWVGAKLTAIGGSTAFDWSVATAAYGRGKILHGSTGFINNTTETDLWFRIFGSPRQADAPQATGGTTDLDNFILELDTTTPGTPLVVFESSDQDVYRLAGTFATGSYNVSVEALTQTSRNLVWNWETRSFTNSDPDVLDDCPYILTSLVEDDPFAFAPGAVSITAPAPASINYRVQYREPFR